MPIFKHDNRLFKVSLCLAFFLSGAAGLFYQVSWQRLLTLTYGVGPVSTTLVVSLFMFGLGVGSLIGGYLADHYQKPMTLYIFVELLLALFGVGSLYFIKALNPLLGHPSFIISSLCVCLFLLFPTVLMGTTLPLVVKALSTIEKNFHHSLSLLYFINTLGAAFGALISSYWLISFYGLDNTIYAASSINLFLAGFMGLVMFIHRHSQTTPSNAVTSSPMPLRLLKFHPNHSYVLATGFLAIGYQILWFRLISIIVKGSPYSFSSVLFIYLLGIAIGSFSIKKISQKYSPETQKNLFFLLNFTIALWVSFTTIFFYHFGQSDLFGYFLQTSFDSPLHPVYHPNSIFFAKTSADWWRAIYVSLDIFLWPTFFLFLPTLCMGASFPLITSLSSRDAEDEGVTTGTFYWWNIVGNTVGGVITGFIALPFLGTEWTLILFTCFGLCWLLCLTQDHRLAPSKYPLFLLILTISLAFLPKKGQLYKEIHKTALQENQYSFIQEDVDGVILAEFDENSRRIFINGLAHGKHPDEAFNVEVAELIAHKPKAKTALVIGFGAGNITDLLLNYPTIEKVTVVELSDALIKAVSKIPYYQKLLEHPKLELLINDGRRYLQTSQNKFDIITMDPLRSTTAYSNNLYSQDFFLLVRKNLASDGLMMAWMNEYTLIPKTIAKTFHNTKMFYYFMLASDGSIINHPEVRNEYISQMTPEMQTEVMKRINKDYYYRGDSTYVLKRGQGYPILTDFKPWAEYYFGLNTRRKLRIWPSKTENSSQ